MARSRYSNTKILDGYYYGSWRNPSAERLDEENILDGIETFDHTLAVGERLDGLAAIYLGDDRYYWVIALVNDITWPLGIAPGTVLKIPRDVRKILDKILR